MLIAEKTTWNGVALQQLNELGTIAMETTRNSQVQQRGIQGKTRLQTLMTDARLKPEIQKEMIRPNSGREMLHGIQSCKTPP